ncbi:hypothetical protein FQN49_008607, partial [Arthroderma sp. PD_2]
GGIMSSGKSSSLSLGEKIIVVGLIIQILFFGFFTIVSFILHRRMNTHPTTASLSLGFSWRRHIYGLYAVSVLILVRSIFRVAEFAQGSNGVLLEHEVYLYVFDAALMFALMVMLNVVHPGVISTLVRGKLALKATDNLEMQPERHGLTGPRGIEATNIRPSFSEST